MMKFHLHATTDEAHLKHRTAPGRACDSHLHRMRTILRVSGDQRRTLAENKRRVEVVLRPNMQHGVRRQTFQEHASLDLGLDNIPIHFVAEIRMRREHAFTLPEVGSHSQDYSGFGAVLWSTV